jgi:shikimate dehydrogenase
MRAAVLGSPVAHSLSPVLHLAAYARLGLDWTYDAYECDEAALPGFVARMDEPGWAGLSLTMPLKAAVLPLLDSVDPLAHRAGAANTVVLRSGRKEGLNTDVPGLVAALAERGIGPGERAVVLGAGATARSALVALADSGWPAATVYARRPERAAELAEAVVGSGLVLEVLAWEQARLGLAADLVVSTVPAGGTDGLAADLPAHPGALFDVVYAPWPTALAGSWLGAGGRVVSGLDLLVHQAARQVVAMTRTLVAVDELVAVMRPAGLAALAAR